MGTEAEAGKPPTGPPTWLTQLVSRVPGNLPLDSAIASTVGTYRRQWRHTFFEALLFYVPGALAVLIVRETLGEPLGSLAAALVLFAGVFWLQSLDVVEAAARREGRKPAPLKETVQRIRPRVRILVKAFLLVMLRLALPTIAFFILFIYVVTETRTVEQIGLYFVERANMAVVWFLLIAFWLSILLYTVRWTMLVPAVLLEGEEAGPSLKRSAELTRGNRARIYAWVIAVMAITLVVTFISGGFFGAVFGDAAVMEFFRDMVTDTLIAPLLVFLWTETYFFLREQRAVATDAVVATPPEKPAH